MKNSNPNILKKEIENDPSNYYLIKELGNLYFIEKQYQDAIKQYSIACNYRNKLSTDIILKFEKQLLKNDIDKKEVLYALVYFYIEQGYEDDALSELYNLVEENIRETKAYELIVKILKKIGKEEEAIKLLEDAINKGIYENFVVDTLKELYLAKGKFIDSIKLLEKITTSDNKNINFLKDLAELYYINDECKRSVGIYKNIVSIHPSTINDAINHIHKIIENKGDDVSYHQILGDFYVRLLKPSEAVREYKIVFENGTGNIEMAIENFKKILEYYPDFIPARLSLADIYILQGSFSEAVMEYNLIYKKQPDKASEIIDGLKNILKNYPNQVLAYQVLYNIYWEINEKQKSFYYMDKCVDISNDGIEDIIFKCNDYLNNEEENLSVIELLAKSYFISNRLDKAQDISEKILNVDSNNLKALYILSEIYKKQEIYDKAKEFLIKKRQIDPIEYNSFLSLKEVKLKLLNQKIDVLKKDLEKNKNLIKNAMDLGISSYYSGKLIDAITYLQKSSSNEEYAPEVHYHLGNCFKEFGRFDLSIDQYLVSLKYNEKISDKFMKEIIFKIGMSNEALGRLEEAKQNYDRIYRLDINYSGINERISQIDKSFTLGLRGKMLAGIFNNLKDSKFIVIYTKNKEEEKYIKTRKKQRNLSFGQDHNDRGVDKLLYGMIQAAEEELLLAEQLDSELPSIKNNLGLIYLIKNDLNKARIKFEEAININKDLAVLYNNLALTYHMAKDYTQAEKLYQFAIEQNDQLGITNLNLGDLKYYQGKLKESLKLWEKAEQDTVLPELARRRMLVGELTFL